MKKLFLTALLLGLTTTACAIPTTDMLNKVTKHVVKVKVALTSGNEGMGSGVVIAKDRIVTNCHVVANAASIKVIVGDKSYTANSITPDWYHDVCLVKVNGLNAPIATMVQSQQLKYQQSVIAIGYPNRSPDPVSSTGYVKSLLPMDNSVIVQTTSTFKRGESGGGLFDDDGNLVGVITLKSPGKQAYYYYMPVEWVQALMDQPEQALDVSPAPAFWAAKAEQWPFFMKVVHPYLNHNWHAVMAIANEWTKREPNNIEAWFYLATAEFALHDMENAKAHMQKVNSMDQLHPQADYDVDLMVNESVHQAHLKDDMTLLALSNVQKPK